MKLEATINGEIATLFCMDHELEMDNLCHSCQLIAQLAALPEDERQAKLEQLWAIAEADQKASAKEPPLQSVPDATGFSE